MCFNYFGPSGAGVVTGAAGTVTGVWFTNVIPTTTLSFCLITKVAVFPFLTQETHHSIKYEIKISHGPSENHCSDFGVFFCSQPSP